MQMRGPYVSSRQTCQRCLTMRWWHLCQQVDSIEENFFTVLISREKSYVRFPLSIVYFSAFSDCYCRTSPTCLFSHHFLTRMAVERTAVPSMTAASAPIMVNVAELMTRVSTAAGSQEE